MDPLSALADLYRACTGSVPARMERLPASGSNRRYVRLIGTPTLIGVSGTSVDENKAFIYLSEHFASKGLPVPRVHAVSADKQMYIQDDLGDTPLFDAIADGRKSGSFSAAEKDLLARTMSLLPDIQFAGAEGLDFSKCFPVAQFDRRSVLWDLNYFKYCFLKATGLDFDEPRLEDDFSTLADILLQCPADSFMYRDFQSRNVMVRDGNPWFIDFQGGRKGPCYYDVASFLWQAKANFPQELRNELIGVYVDSLKKYVDVDRSIFDSHLRYFVLFRTLQVLGAYGFRGFFENKPHFLQSVPFALANLRALLQEPFIEIPTLDGLLHRLALLPRFEIPTQQDSGLTVTVMSFGYKNGIPADNSGNGGGFVFDCRALNNPGRYDRYKSLTGLDKDVIDFLEDDGEIITFLNHCYDLVDNSTSRYIDRGFTSLMVAFGCTGGQHRSVYCAQHMAWHIHNKFNVKVKLVHREQNIRMTLD